MTFEELRRELGLVRVELADVKVDLSIERSKNEQLTKELAEANRNLRQAERDTMTVQTLSLDDEDTAVDPRNTGQFYGWKGGER